MADDTIFDQILAGKIPAQVVYEDEQVLAFRDVNPQSPVHVLVIPKKKIERYADLKDESAEVVGAFFKKVADIAQELDLETNGYRVVINNGRYGQQSVEYLHAHILGGRQLSWPPG